MQWAEAKAGAKTSQKGPPPPRRRCRTATPPPPPPRAEFEERVEGACTHLAFGLLGIYPPRTQGDLLSTRASSLRRRAHAHPVIPRH